MRRRQLALLTLVVLAPAACSRGEHPWEVRSFAWEGRLDDRAIRIRNTNGPIEVRESPDGLVHVNAEKRWNGRRPQPVRFLVDSARSGLTVCATWGKRGGECTASRYRSRHESWWQRLLYRRTSVDVRFVVQVPRGVRVDVETVNGKVEIGGAGGDVKAKTVNGAIETSTSAGRIEASTVNGAVRAHLDAVDGAGNVDLSTVNGSVTAELPETLGASIDLSTVNGRIDSELPITLDGGMSRTRLRGTIGDGASRVRISTVNGSVTLRKS